MLRKNHTLALTFFMCCFTMTSVEAANYGGTHGRYCYKKEWGSPDGECGWVFDPKQEKGVHMGIRWMETKDGTCSKYNALDASDVKSSPNEDYTYRYIEDFEKADKENCKAE